MLELRDQDAGAVLVSALRFRVLVSKREYECDPYTD